MESYLMSKYGNKKNIIKMTKEQILEIPNINPRKCEILQKMYNDEEFRLQVSLACSQLVEQFRSMSWSEIRNLNITDWILGRRLITLPVTGYLTFNDLLGKSPKRLYGYGETCYELIHDNLPADTPERVYLNIEKMFKG